MQDVKECLFVRRQRLARKELDKVPEVVATAERTPSAPILVP